MGHCISGIITSFKYEGDLPHIVLVGNFRFIPRKRAWGKNYSEPPVGPYANMNAETRKLLKELSFKGACAYVETDYFGGPGSQMSEAWQDGVRALGPLISFDGVDPRVPEGAREVKDAINESLRLLGVYRHEGMDEFDSVRLGWYRSNRDAIEEFELKQAQND